MQRQDTNKFCANVAETIRSRFVSDALLGPQQNSHSMTWRRSYVDKITAGHVKTFVSSILRMIMEIDVSKTIFGDGVPTPAVREEGMARDARYQFDVALLEFHHKQRKAATTSEDSA